MFNRPPEGWTRYLFAPIPVSKVRRFVAEMANIDAGPGSGRGGRFLGIVARHLSYFLATMSASVRLGW
jgi:hypothetical protein